ncbi:hypothetical protein C7I85_24205 [Mesorhizobium soli]|uniref:Uncharacterized protein n=1 Tax=Pseudaminobacter soli (ex Li et al. 2025) TaxID=1295366 RepID=A0A2P7S2G7_9HYPH|nr:hypothetical protein C7I85_24205 [Mesorhizobium soli]
MVRRRAQQRERKMQAIIDLPLRTSTAGAIAATGSNAAQDEGYIFPTVAPTCQWDSIWNGSYSSTSNLRHPRA